MEDQLGTLDAALARGEGLEEAVGELFQLAASSDLPTRNTLLQSLDDRIRIHPEERGVPLAMLAGALVELGAQPDLFPSTVFDRLLAQLITIEGDEDTLPELYFSYEQAAMACLSRSAQLRRELPQKTRLITSIWRYQERYGFLGKMLHVLDAEPLVVVHPASGRGFRFQMSGIADNFQLHLLLLDRLAALGTDGIVGDVPSSEAVAAASDGEGNSTAMARSGWQLASFAGARCGAAFVDVAHNACWIWNEGVPADIPLFEGERVILLGESSIARSWNAQRVFPGMLGRLDFVGSIPALEVERLFVAMAGSSST